MGRFFGVIPVFSDVARVDRKGFHYVWAHSALKGRSQDWVSRYCEELGRFPDVMPWGRTHPIGISYVEVLKS